MNGYVDIQLNGYYGVNFNDNEMTAEAFHATCLKLREHGVRMFLPTIITASMSDMCTRLSNLARYVATDPLAREMAPGFHVEGPMINEAAGYRGAHPEQHVIPAAPDNAKRLVAAGGGNVRLVTLAPERDAGMAATRWLSSQGVKIAAGHTNASLDDLKAACDAGLTLFTHLGNGVPMNVNRHDNIVQRALSLRDRITLCLIGDGVHIPLFALGNYLSLIGCDRAVVVTDGISVAGLGAGAHRLRNGETVVVDDSLAVWSADRSHLCGSALTMPQLEKNLRNMGFNDQQIRQLACENPARAMGLK
jgi:N-acetylglucosamine-6-phosphate deacetylase